MKDYKTVAQAAQVELVIQKSRFIGHCFPVKAEEQALQLLEGVRKEHWNASHNCYAYVLGENGQTARYSDDGEPGGTAGLPMMNVLKQRELQDLLVVVTRYFGGVLLGTGGLVRAYSKACGEAVRAASTLRYCACSAWMLEIAYPLWDKMERFLQGQTVLMGGPLFTDKVLLKIWVPLPEEEALERAIVAQSEGRVCPKRQGEEHKAWPVEERPGS